VIEAWLKILVSLTSIGIYAWILIDSRKEVRRHRARNLSTAADTMRTLDNPDKAGEYEHRAAGTWWHNRGLDLP
jgi:hypothetical protein